MALHSKWTSGNLAFYDDRGAASAFTILGSDPSKTSGDIIGFQAKPAGETTSASTATVYGGQVQPRFNNGSPGASLVGLSVEPILKGATAAALSGDLRGIEVGFSADGAGHTVAGTASAIRLYNLLKASTFTGGIYGINMETHGDTQAWSGFLKIAADGVIAKYSAGHYTPADADGGIYVNVGGHALWIPCYASLT